MKRENSSIVKSFGDQQTQVILAEAARRAAQLTQRSELLTGYGAISALEDELTAMSIFTVGVITEVCPMKRENSSIVKSFGDQQTQVILAEAARRAAQLSQRRELLTGFNAISALEDELTAMSIFTVGVITGQQPLANQILQEASAPLRETKP